MKLKKRTVKSRWQYTRWPEHIVLDPRIPVIRHIEWEPQRVAGFPEQTRWNGIEPSAYNFAIWSEQPQLIEGIKDQCWYKDQQNGGWISLYVVNEYNQPALQATLDNIEVWGIWTPRKLSAFRTRIPTIAYDKHIRWGKLAGRTFDERLYDQGYYDLLLERGLDDQWLKQHIGEPSPYEIVHDVNNEIEDSE